MRAASGVSPGSTLPPGNSQSPASGRPGGRLASSTRPSASMRAQATTSRMSKPMPTLQPGRRPLRRVLARCRRSDHPPRDSPPSLLAAPQRRSHRTEATLAAVISIDGDVIVRQIAGPGRGLGGPNPDVGMDQDLAALHIGGDRAFDIVGRSLPIARHFMWAKSDRELVAVRRLTGLADGHDDAAPVGVLAKNCRL